MERKALKVFYGSTALYKVYCLECEDYRIVLKGIIQCCDVPVKKPREFEMERQTVSVYKRQYISKKIKNKILINQNYKCFYCDEKLDKINIDHLIPWSYAANNDKSNLVASCIPCNMVKFNIIFDTIEDAKNYVKSRKEVGCEE